MSQSRSVSLMFPAWNEEDYVERAVSRAMTALRRVRDARVSRGQTPAPRVTNVVALDKNKRAV